MLIRAIVRFEGLAMLQTFRSKSAGFAPFLLALTVTTAAAVAALPTTDGALPIYPGVTSPPGMPANFWSSGAYREMSVLELFTQDDEATVDAWYRPRLKNYARKSISAHGHSSATYDGSGGTVKILGTAGEAGEEWAKYGKTVIFLNPVTK
jgi:hypothetical protein